MHVLPKVAGAVLVIATGAGLWAAGQVQARHAATRRAFLMMRDAGPVEDLETGRFLPASWRADLETRRAESRYWLRQYDGFARGDDERGAAYLMHVANAAYRAMAAALTEETPVERLDDTARLYLDVLDDDPSRIDAAYNYEFVIRRKNALRRDRAARRRAATAAASPGPESTIHGEPGVAPPPADTNDFKIVVPQRPEERRQQPDAGTGAGRTRKG